MSKAHALAKLNDDHTRIRQAFSLAVLKGQLKKATKLEHTLETLEQKRKKCENKRAVV